MVVDGLLSMLWQPTNKASAAAYTALSAKGGRKEALFATISASATSSTTAAACRESIRLRNASRGGA